MPDYKYLIIGGGMTAAAAIKGIREIDTEGSIGVVSQDVDPPYKRPPLSKKLWQGKPFDIVWRGMSVEGADVHLQHTVTAIHPGEKRVVDEEGTSYSYDRLLLATGGTPRTLPFGGDKIMYFRTLADYRSLRALSEQKERFAVIGGGFIGSEIAAALAMNGKRVTMVLPGKGIGERVYPPDVVEFLSGYFRDKGVELLMDERATGLDERADSLVLHTKSGCAIEVDGVVAGIGIEPNTALAEAAGLTVDDGVVVDRNLATSHPDIFAAGDIASYWDHTLGRRRRVEHEDNANTMGKYAGRSMAGQPEPYLHLPFFYSDLFELGYEAVGDLDSRLEMVADWKEPYKEGVIYYLGDGRVRGVLLWNVWGQVKAARSLVSSPGPYRPEDLKGRLPEVSEK
jgi:NADPH-dependent 2,4-dienoyl-CoA reductase/sulfur reductase-like enzyme